jgi:hypothetical protein
MTRAVTCGVRGHRARRRVLQVLLKSPSGCTGRCASVWQVSSGVVHRSPGQLGRITVSGEPLRDDERKRTYDLPIVDASFTGCGLGSKWEKANSKGRRRRSKGSNPRWDAGWAAVLRGGSGRRRRRRGGAFVRSFVRTLRRSTATAAKGTKCSRRTRQGSSGFCLHVQGDVKSVDAKGSSSFRPKRSAHQSSFPSAIQHHAAGTSPEPYSDPSANSL